MRKTDSDELIQKPKERKPKSADQALSSLMRLCSRAEKSSGDAMRLMRTWQVPESDRQAVLERLISMRFIDDSRYAEAYVREKSSLAGWGARKIAQQLRIKGISREIIASVLATLDNEELAERLEERLRKKLRTTKYTTTYDLRGKLLRYALGLGYDYDVVTDVVSRVVQCDD